MRKSEISVQFSLVLRGRSMKPVYLDEIKAVKPSSYGGPQIGYFALDSEYGTLSWDKCREQFAQRFCEATSGFFFCHNIDEGYRVAEFISKTEEILGFTDYLHSYAPSTFCKTSRNDVLWINVSRFWVAHEIRRQFLTILLRAGMGYDSARNNYEEALWAMRGFDQDRLYCQETKNAVMRFLFGFTEYIATDIQPTHRGGWVEVFKNKDESTIRHMLGLPKGERPVNCMVGLGKLWT